MRIAINTRVLLKGRMEGVCRYIHETVQCMVKAHPEDHFYFIFDRPYGDSFIYSDNVTPIVIGPPTRDPILWYAWFEYALPRVLKKYDIDVLLSPDNYLSLKTLVPTVLVSHDIAYAHYPEHLPRRVLRYYRKYFPRFHRKAKRIVAVSEATRKDIITQYNLDPTKVVVGHNSAPTKFKPLSETRQQEIRNDISDGRPYFIYVGAVHPRKNVVRIVRAFNRFKDITGSDFKLLIIGRDAWKNQEFDRELVRSKYRNDIIWKRGYAPEVHEYVAAAFALIYVSLFEGFGIPILEAMHCDVPVICSNVSSMPEVAGDAALLTSPYNAEEIAGSMRYILDDGIRQELIKKAKIQRSKFSWQRTADIIHEQLFLALKS